MQTIYCDNAVACLGIHKGGGAKIWKHFFQYFKGGPAQKLADKIIFPTKKIATYRWNGLKFALMTFFFAFQFLGGGGPGHASDNVTMLVIIALIHIMYIIFTFVVTIIIYFWFSLVISTKVLDFLQLFFNINIFRAICINTFKQRINACLFVNSAFYKYV